MIGIMAGWMVMSAHRCTPVMELLYRELHAGQLIDVDVCHFEDNFYRYHKGRCPSYTLE